MANVPNAATIVIKIPVDSIVSKDKITPSGVAANNTTKTIVIRQRSGPIKEVIVFLLMIKLLNVRLNA